MHASVILNLIRTSPGVTRTELVAATGLGRGTLAQRLDPLIAHGLVREGTQPFSTGGRPPQQLTFDASARLVLAADLGARHARLAASDLDGAPIAERTFGINIEDGAEQILPQVSEAFHDVLLAAGRDRNEVLGIGIGVPGSVPHGRGSAISPSVMPGWDGVPIAEWLASRWGCPVLVDNDANLMGLGEHRWHWRDVDHLLFVKVGTGIGCALVSNGQIHRGT